MAQPGRAHQELLPPSGANFTPEEVAFFSEEVLITILPSVVMPVLHLIRGKFGPFRPGMAVEVPLWLAVSLKKLQKCKIKPPTWMTVEYLERKLEAEKSEESLYMEMPFHYVEISTILLSCAQDDIVRVHRVRTLLEDIADYRNRKMRNTLRELEPDMSAAMFTNLSHMEINNFRIDIVKTLNAFHQITQGEVVAAGPPTQMSSYTPSLSQSGTFGDMETPGSASAAPMDSPAPLRAHRRQRQALGLDSYTQGDQASPDGLASGGSGSGSASLPHDDTDMAAMETAGETSGRERGAADIRHTTLSPTMFAATLGDRTGRAPDPDGASSSPHQASPPHEGHAGPGAAAAAAVDPLAEASGSLSFDSSLGLSGVGLGPASQPGTGTGGPSLGHDTQPGEGQQEPDAEGLRSPPASQGSPAAGPSPGSGAGSQGAGRPRAGSDDSEGPQESPKRARRSP